MDWIGLDQIRSVRIGFVSNEFELDSIGSDRIRSDRILFDWIIVVSIGSDSIRLDRI